MPIRLAQANASGGITDHSDVIVQLRTRGAGSDLEADRVTLNLAADLLEAHDDSGISLDDWPWARRFVELLSEQPIVPNFL